ncbi:hypothetical protein MGA5115_00112 [Marinomonas gallaica]|uniref:Uncharacterized protein n=1 Tax=Marinomonas gallaica TaxID=1806667 RepID=A0A1C3JLF2_9GAMM|nr:hypothetical protein [Marinomonas gallaica]SBT16038.1 hypothetical protein MGA5115_00112 [Marinomonas gallaica]SBT21086.1 hypothetical protein MGA5116_01673 [Marinomonas gallaica]
MELPKLLLMSGMFLVLGLQQRLLNNIWNIMKFNDLFFSKEKYFSVGIEEESGDYYVSIPVSNRSVDYEEYYRISEKEYYDHKDDLSQLEYVAEECRKKLRDNDLIIKPGADRGIPI